MKYEFIHLSTFTADARRADLTADDVRAIENAVAVNPDAAPIMPGTGGLRKIRYARKASSGGMSGGVRVCYFVVAPAAHVWLVTVFAKNEKANLNKAESNAFRMMIAALRATYDPIF